MSLLRFVSYTRVSTDEQADYGTGLETQSLENRLYVERIGGTIVAEFSDPGISGTIYPRPGIAAALECLQRGEANALIVHRVDRLGRKLWVCSLAQKHIQDTGARLFSAEDGEVTEDNIILFALRCGMAQTDYQGIIKRLYAGRKRLAEKGVQPTRVHPPYGYHIVKKIEDGMERKDAGTYVVIEEQAEIVRLIFALYASGVTMIALTKRLQQQVPPPGNGKHWYAHTLSRILHNTAYIGTAGWGKTRLEKGRQVPLPESVHISIPVPALIEMEIWKQCQRRLEENKSLSARHDRTHLFAGLVICPVCSRRCAAQRCKGGKYVRYHCRYNAPTHAPDGVVCNRHDYYEGSILSAVRRVFERLVNDPLFLPARLQEYQKQHHAVFDEAAYKVVLEALMNLDREEAETARAHRAALARGAGATSFDGLYDDIVAKRKRLIVKRDGMEEIRDRQQSSTVDMEEVQKFAHRLMEVLDDPRLTTSEKNQFLRQTIERIEPSGKSFKVMLRAIQGVYL